MPDDNNGRRKEDKLHYKAMDALVRSLITAAAVVTAVALLGGYLWVSKDDFLNLKSDVKVINNDIGHIKKGIERIEKKL